MSIRCIFRIVRTVSTVMIVMALIISCGKIEPAEKPLAQATLGDIWVRSTDGM